MRLTFDSMAELKKRGGRTHSSEMISKDFDGYINVTNRAWLRLSSSIG